MDRARNTVIERTIGLMVLSILVGTDSRIHLRSSVSEYAPVPAVLCKFVEVKFSGKNGLCVVVCFFNDCSGAIRYKGVSIEGH